MMKNYIYIFVLVFYSCSEGQKSEKSIYNSNDSLKDVNTNSFLKLQNKEIRINDTIFLHRKITKSFYHAIYIETNKNSKFHTQLKNFNFKNSEIKSFQNYHNLIKKKDSEAFKKLNITEIPQDWIPVYKYRNDYYLYAPSDWGNAGRRIINDSSFVFWYMDGIIPYPLKSIKKISNHKYNLELIDYFSGIGTTTEITIYEINEKTKLSVFEFLDKSGTKYGLFIPKESAKYYNMIVNYCKTDKQYEFKFDKINYDKLILNSH